MKPNIQDVDLKLLRVFREVARHEGFSAAQDALDTTQSAISMSMSQLEERLGMRLCERGVKGFRLTGHGKEVLACIDRLFAALDEFRSDTERLKGRITGTLRLGFVDNVSFSGEFLLPEAISLLKERYAELAIDIFVGAPQELEERLLDGRLRAAIGLFHRRNARLHYQKLFVEHHELFCGRTHPFYDLEDGALDHQMLQQSNYVGRDYLEAYRPLKPPIDFSPVASSRYIEGLATLVLSGAYLAYLPTHYAAGWAALGKMRSIRPDEFRRGVNISLVYRKSRAMDPGLKAFVDILSGLKAP